MSVKWSVNELYDELYVHQKHEYITINLYLHTPHDHFMTLFLKTHTFNSKSSVGVLVLCVYCQTCL